MPSPVTKISSKDLKAYLATNRNRSRLIGPVERYMLARPVDQSRRQDVLHPSEIVKDDWCIREAYYRILDARKGVYPPKEVPGLRLQSIFDEGHAIHAKWQRYLADMGNLWGDWKCAACGTKVGPSSRPPACLRCPSKNFEYAELSLVDDEHLIQGSTDGWVTDLGPDFLLEVKSIGTGTIRVYEPRLLMNNDNNLEAAFNDIRRPFSDHRRQVTLYLHLAHLMADRLEREAPKEALVLYECKANQAYKEFVIGYDPTQVEEVMELAKDVVWALDRLRPPACLVGGPSGCKKCAPYNARESA